MKERISHELHAAMERVLRANPCSITGVILRLAYYEGLTRDEINNLQWDQVDFEEKQLCLSKRNVPLEGDTEACLRQWRILCGEAGGSVVVSEKSRKPLTPQSVSRIVRTALDAEGETGVRLLDLRTDYIRRQLEEHDWPYVLRVSGLSVTTYRNTLADTVPKGEAYQKEPCDAKEKEFRIWKILQSNQTTPAGIALWLSYQLGLQNEEIVSLTWDEVDFERGQIRLPGRSIALSNALSRILKAEQNTRTAEDDPHVILTPRTRKPLNNARLSTIVGES